MPSHRHFHRLLALGMLLAMPALAAGQAALSEPFPLNGNWEVQQTLAIEPLPLLTPELPLPEPPPEIIEPVGPPILAAPPPPPPKLWAGSVEFGVNGTEGNSENFNFRFLVNAKRKTESNILTLNSRYTNNTADNNQTANRLFLEGRDEWLLGATPWSLYAHNTVEYDEFRAFDVRVTGDAGIGYQFLKNDVRSLLGRAGPGFSQELGGPDDAFVPEAAFGLNYEQQLTARTRFSASTDYFPEIGEFSNFRLNSQANWEMLLDEVLNISVKLSILDRYDSTPNGAKANDLDYSLTLLWSF